MARGALPADHGTMRNTGLTQWWAHAIVTTGAALLLILLNIR